MATNLNKTIHILALGDAWQQYARMVPTHITPLGVVQRKHLTQAFGRDANGDYWAFGTGTPELLPQAKIQRAIAALTLKAENPQQGADSV